MFTNQCKKMIYRRTVRPLLGSHYIISGRHALPPLPCAPSWGAVLPDWSSESSRLRAPHQEGAQAPAQALSVLGPRLLPVAARAHQGEATESSPVLRDFHSVLISFPVQLFRS